MVITTPRFLLHLADSRLIIHVLAVSLVTQLNKWLLSLLFFRTLENVTLFGAEWGRGDLASPSPLLAGA